MSYNIKTYNIKSTDNIHSLFCKIYIPSLPIKGIIQVVHGMNEYIERYNNFMSFFAEKGYIVVGHDHLGHGKTALNDRELGYFSQKNGWSHLCDDVKSITEFVKKDYPTLPIYLFGRSMGSFITRITVNRYSNLYDKFIICGTSGENPLASVGLMLTNIFKVIKGDKYVSKFILNMAFSSYNKKFDNITKYEWLTKDREIINKYINDKFCMFDFTVSAMHDLITLCKKCNINKWFKDFPKHMPVFIISGSDDPVGNYGKGVIEVYNKLKKYGSNVTYKLYKNCRHEIHNDSCKDEVFYDILNFIK